MKALIILPATSFSPSMFRTLWQDSDVHVYADNLSLTPLDTNYIITGDGDSNIGSLYQTSNKFILNSDQDTTDSEKALRYILNNYPEVVEINIIYTIFERSDHFLYNINLLNKYYNDKIRINIINKTEKKFLVNKTVAIKTQKNMKFAMFAMFGAIDSVSTTGLKWNLNKERIKMSVLDSVANVTKDTVIGVRLNEDNDKYVTDKNLLIIHSLDNGES